MIRQSLYELETVHQRTRQEWVPLLLPTSRNERHTGMEFVTDTLSTGTRPRSRVFAKSSKREVRVKWPNRPRAPSPQSMNDPCIRPLLVRHRSMATPVRSAPSATLSGIQ